MTVARFRKGRGLLLCIPRLELKLKAVVVKGRPVWLTSQRRTSRGSFISWHGSPDSGTLPVNIGIDMSIIHVRKQMVELSHSNHKL
jgi:hypothetical protein